MTWIKTKTFLPPTHEIILFRDIHGNEHYGVLCGELANESKRDKFWCHIFQKTYNKKDVIYWCEIPINKHFIRESNEFSLNVNAFLWDAFRKIESEILEESKEHQENSPNLSADELVHIAARNCLHRMISLVMATNA